MKRLLVVIVCALAAFACNAPKRGALGGVPGGGFVPPTKAGGGGAAVAAEINILSYGWFGPGTDGSPTFDGSTTVLGMVPSSSTYTLARDIFLDAPICNSGVTIKTAGFALFVKTDFHGPASGTCAIHDNGPDAANQNHGTGRVNGAPDGGTGRLRGGKSGGDGGCNNAFGSNGNASVNASQGFVTGNAGAGGSPFPGTGATSTAASSPAYQGSIGFISNAVAGFGGNAVSIFFTGGSGGGGGGSNGVGTGCGGGGGAGGGYTVFASKHFTNPTHVTIAANGGAGGNASAQAGGNSAGGGGGGGGGYAILIVGYDTAPTPTASAGLHGNGAGGSGTNGSDGTSGQAITFRMN